VERLDGWRIAMASGAAITIELWAGALQAVDVRVGDCLCLVPAFADGLAVAPARPPMPAAAPVPSPTSLVPPDSVRS